ILVLEESVQPDHDGILLMAIVAGREVDVEIAALAQRLRPNAKILAAIIRMIDNGAVKFPVGECQPVGAENGTGKRRRRQKESQQRSEPGGAFHGCSSLRSMLQRRYDMLRSIRHETFSA